MVTSNQVKNFAILGGVASILSTMLIQDSHLEQLRLLVNRLIDEIEAQNRRNDRQDTQIQVQNRRNDGQDARISALERRVVELERQNDKRDIQIDWNYSQIKALQYLEGRNQELEACNNFLHPDE